VVPGTTIRFGLDALIGLVPGIGDAITTAVALYIVNEARALGAPPLLIARMLANVALDGVVGVIPLVGDAFDVAFRANRRNMALLRDHLDRDRRTGFAYRMRESDYR
jgi:predicted SpoU family rRNA methylase